MMWFWLLVLYINAIMFGVNLHRVVVIWRMEQRVTWLLCLVAVVAVVNVVIMSVALHEGRQ